MRMVIVRIALLSLLTIQPAHAFDVFGKKIQIGSLKENLNKIKLQIYDPAKRKYKAKFKVVEEVPGSKFGFYAGEIYKNPTYLRVLFYAGSVAYDMQFNQDSSNPIRYVARGGSANGTYEAEVTLIRTTDYVEDYVGRFLETTANTGVSRTYLLKIELLKPGYNYVPANNGHLTP